MPAVILSELSWSCNSEMNSSMGEMLVKEEVNISSSLDGNISNCDLVRRVDDCELCTTIDYWLEGPIIFAVCLAGILGWWLWESASFMFMSLLWSHWCLKQPSEQKTKNLAYSQMNIYHYHWVFLKNSKKALCAKMYNNIYYSDDKGKDSTSLSTLCPDQRKSRSTNVLPRKVKILVSIQFIQNPSILKVEVKLQTCICFPCTFLIGSTPMENLSPTNFLSVVIFRGRKFSTFIYKNKSSSLFTFQFLSFFFYSSPMRYQQLPIRLINELMDILVKWYPNTKNNHTLMNNISYWLLPIRVIFSTGNDRFRKSRFNSRSIKEGHRPQTKLCQYSHMPGNTSKYSHMPGNTSKYSHMPGNNFKFLSCAWS